MEEKILKRIAELEILQKEVTEQAQTQLERIAVALSELRNLLLNNNPETEKLNQKIGEPILPSTPPE